MLHNGISREDPLKTILCSAIQETPGSYEEIGRALAKGDLVCLPTPSGYKLAADLDSPKAITALLQAKRRVGNAPALVFVPDASFVPRVAAEVSDAARALMRTFWPGPLTLLFKASEDLPPQVRKPLTKAKGWIGVRVPDDAVSLAVVRAFGAPLLVSSANLSAKHGANSVAQVRKNFGRTAALLLDGGDLQEAPKSTLVDVTSDMPHVVRAAAIPEEAIQKALAG